MTLCFGLLYKSLRYYQPKREVFQTYQIESGVGDDYLVPTFICNIELLPREPPALWTHTALELLSNPFSATGNASKQLANVHQFHLALLKKK